ncbi:hypothetical protein NPX13_g261 [Xylaria arbuscula]|uniref:Uncharacterized protein n=1 Tax=Xylaria arbuscula TaxID=114810 RepID=A0A9W8TS15_9PEZI|nr:hypothetical protein NPX13_g261 [Xylaria arbuscula]
MVETMHSSPTGAGSSEFMPLPPLQPVGYYDGDISGAHLNYDNHDTGMYVAMQNYPQETPKSREASPGSIASEDECGNEPDDGHFLLRKLMRFIPRGWSLETSGLFLTLAAFVSLLSVLKRVDNQPLSTWNFVFSVNTVVSTLSILVKTPLAFAIGSCLGQGKWSWFTKQPGPLSGFVAFDDAGRGPLGCVALLWWLKSRHWASLGAWVTLLLLGVDPFWQAVLQYSGKLVLVEHDNSSILTSQRLNVGDWYGGDALTLDYHGYSNVYHSYLLYPDVGMSATLLIAAVNSTSSDLTQLPGISCRTGNCTWPIHTTLGICNTCFDITDQIITEEKVGMPDENVFSSCHDKGYTRFGNYTNYVVPYPTTRRTILQNYDGYIRQSSCKLRSRVGLSPAFQPFNTYKFKDSQTLLASFALLELPDAYWNNLTSLKLATPKATECALEFCGLTYEAQMRDGRPRETALSISKNRVNESYSPVADLSPEIRGYIQKDSGNSLLEYFDDRVLHFWPILFLHSALRSANYNTTRHRLQQCPRNVQHFAKVYCHVDIRSITKHYTRYSHLRHLKHDEHYADI